MRKPGGITIADAVARAGQRVEAVRESCVAALDEMIEALAAAANVDGVAATGAVYAQASEIYNLSALFKLTELAEAAASLCELVVNYRETEASGGHVASTALAASVQVHADALRTLRRPDLSGDAAARAAIVAGLRRVAQKSKAEKTAASA